MNARNGLSELMKGHLRLLTIMEWETTDVTIITTTIISPYMHFIHLLEISEIDFLILDIFWTSIGEKLLIKIFYDWTPLNKRILIKIEGNCMSIWVAFLYYIKENWEEKSFSLKSNNIFQIITFIFYSTKFRS